MILCQISDLHVRERGDFAYGVVDTPAMLERAVARIAALDPRPDLVVATGDLVDSGEPEQYGLLAEILSGLPMPVYLLPGNHDEREALRAAFPRAGYLRGWDFVQYAVEDGPVRVLALDTLVPGDPGGRLCERRLEWLAARLAEQPERPTVLAMHHPPFRTGIPFMDACGLDDIPALAAVVSRHPQVERVICGHLHRPIVTRFAGSVASTCPSPAHQIVFDLRPDAEVALVMEPPAFQLHAWRAQTGLVSHTVYIDEFAGPYGVR